MKEKKTKIKRDLFREIRSIKSDSKNTGITLIALIITIIVLLILAGVVINMTVGEQGIISKAQNAVDKYKVAQEQEESMIAKIEAEVDKHLEGKSITSKITSSNVKDHIGEYINLGTNLIDLETTGHKADWRIFDADSTGVYAILSDYLPNTTTGFPDKMKVSDAADAKEVTIHKNEEGWRIWWTESDDENISDVNEAIGTLTTTSNWDFLAKSNQKLKGHITGAPTYFQFVKSWNKINSEIKLMDDTKITDYEWEEYDEYTGETTSSLDGYLGPYFLELNDEAMGYFVATDAWSKPGKPFMFSALKYLQLGGSNLDKSYKGSCSIRPLVHLTSDFNVDGQDANGVWQLAK